MESRTLDNLILENEDYIFAGNLTIEGDCILKKSKLIVSGTITFLSPYADVIIDEGSEIAAETITSNVVCFIKDSYLYCKNLLSSCNEAPWIAYNSNIVVIN